MKPMRFLFLLLLLTCLSTTLCATDVVNEDNTASLAMVSDAPGLVALQAPLTTFIEAKSTIPNGANAIQALIEIPANAPSDLGVGAYIKDDDGNWFQLPQQHQVGPGVHHLHFSLEQSESWQAEPNFHTWNNYQHMLAHNFGLFFWSEHSNTCNIDVQHLRAVTHTFIDSTDEQYRLLDLSCDHMNAAGTQCHTTTGERWSLRCRIEPMAANPYDSDQFALDLLVSGPDGELRIPGFYQQPMRIIDGGDKDRTLPNGRSFFSARFRPRKPGTYQLQLEARWQTDDSEHIVHCQLPELVVAGDEWDEYVRVDETDKRFFRVGVDKRFHWPLGMNIRSVTDPRATQRTYTKVTPDRIVQAYTRYFERLSRAGANNCEIWMASWNVGLEWYDGWPGFHGIGAYHEGNAARLDAILDAAWENGLRVILVINNHGQASYKSDREWSFSPFNKKNGGPLSEAKDFFTHEVPLHAQQERRRYIVGRYADHPAILCWKMFSEMNLTDMARNGDNGKEQLRIWHKNAFDAWRALDVYDHPVTSHWSGDYKTPFRDIVALENMDFTAIDAYHGRRRGRGRLLAQIMYNSTLHPELGLSAYNKPLVCTEFGASSGAGPYPQLIAEHMSGPWAALMSGHASSPHLWWYEWVDQGDRFHPFRALSNYMAGEDFRHPQARCVHLDVSAENKRVIWCRAWFKPGHIYAYLLDWDWGYDGVQSPLLENVHIQIGQNIKAGAMHIEWWDASIGHRLSAETFTHDSGPLRLRAPAFRRHLAFKLRRLSDGQSAAETNNVSTPD